MLSTAGRVLAVLDREGVLARHRIAESIGFTRATVSKITQALIDEGILIESERAQGSRRGGPRPILLGINSQRLNFVGLDIRREKFTGVLMDLGGQVIATAARELKMSAPRQDLLYALNSILGEFTASAVEIAAIGIGSIGPVSAREGTVQSRHFTALNGFPLVAHLGEAWGVPVDLTIGAVAAAHGEERIAARAQSPAKSIAFVVIDYAGIGLGLTSGGDGWITDHGGVGELGHVSIDHAGRPCSCGRQGCLVQYAGGRALLDSLELGQTGNAGAELSRLAEAADAGDTAVQQALLQAGEYLGIGLVDVDRLLRPERIVIGASHERMADWYLKGASKVVDALPDTKGERPLRDRLHLASMGSTAISYGAAALQLKTFLRKPEPVLDRLRADPRRHPRAFRTPPSPRPPAE